MTDAQSDLPPWLKSEQQEPQRCHKCNKISHFLRDCPNASYAERRRHRRRKQSNNHRPAWLENASKEARGERSIQAMVRDLVAASHEDRRLSDELVTLLLSTIHDRDALRRRLAELDRDAEEAAAAAATGAEQAATTESA